MSQSRGKLVRVAASIAVVIISIAFVLSLAPRARADDVSADPRVQQGLVIAPVPLNLQGKDQALVGLGSYFVNAMASCNDCHSAGPQTQFLPGGNPAFGQPGRTNPATYMGGGRDFGPLIPGSANIVSRNLTPGKSGQPEGDHTLAEFTDMFRTGVDHDNVHPTCTGAPNQNCIPAPFRGDLLQIMPWFNYKNLHFPPQSLLRGAEVGTLCWLGFTATTSYATALFSMQPKALWAINAGYNLVSFVLAGAILGVWR